MKCLLQEHAGQPVEPSEDAWLDELDWEPKTSVDDYVVPIHAPKAPKAGACPHNQQGIVDGGAAVPALRVPASAQLTRCRTGSAPAARWSKTPTLPAGRWSTHRARRRRTRAPRWSRTRARSSPRAASWSTRRGHVRRPAALRWRESMAGELHPASRIRSSPDPPSLSHWWAKVWRSWWTWSLGIPA